jgi:hypothetical protein
MLNHPRGISYTYYQHYPEPVTAEDYPTLHVRHHHRHLGDRRENADFRFAL